MSVPKDLQVYPLAGLCFGDVCLGCLGPSETAVVHAFGVPLCEHHEVLIAGVMQRRLVEALSAIDGIDRGWPATLDFGVDRGWPTLPDVDGDVATEDPTPREAPPDVVDDDGLDDCNGEPHIASETHR